MATAHGNDGKVYSGSNQIGHVQSWTYDETVDAVDGSGMGDTSRDWKTGINDGAGSVVLNWNPADTGQGDISIGASVEVKLYPEGNVSGDTGKPRAAPSAGVTRFPSGDQAPRNRS
jgi:hypothetical protein